MELIFLGTGAGVPSKERNVSSIALNLLQEDNHMWLFDCGEGTQHQILRTSIKPRKINKIFITHLHGDHIFGLPGFLSSRSFQNGVEPLTIYGPKGIKEFLDTTFKVSKSHLTYDLNICEIEDGDMLKVDHFTVYIKKLQHGIDSFGYRLVEDDAPGELLVDKLTELGVKPGPIYAQIKKNEYVDTADFGRLYRKDFVGPNKKGKIITIMGDTKFNLEHVSFVEESDVLVHEATFAANQAEMARNYFHSTSVQAAELAKKGRVKRLIITHISSRFQKEASKQLLEEAREVFQETDLAHDFYNTVIE